MVPSGERAMPSKPPLRAARTGGRGWCGGRARMPAIEGVLLRLMMSEVTGARMSRGWKLVLSSQKVRPPASLPVGQIEKSPNR